MKEKKLIVIPKMTGTEENVTVTIREAVFLENEDSSLQSPQPEFGTWLVDQLYNRQKILAIKRGLFKKSFWCPVCNTELSSALRASIESSYKLEFSGYPPFFIDLIMPSVMCPQCEKSSGIDFDGLLDYNLTEALMHAFRSRYVRP